MKSLVLGGLLLAVSALLPLGASGQSVRPGDLKVFRYGQEQPTVVCVEMRICSVELQAGEDVQGQPLVADTTSWSVVVYRFGEGATRRAEIAVKPLLCGVSTNMVVPTTRRRYELSLLSAPCRDVDDWDHNAAYTRRVRFYYLELTAMPGLEGRVRRVGMRRVGMLGIARAAVEEADAAGLARFDLSRTLQELGATAASMTR